MKKLHSVSKTPISRKRLNIFKSMYNKFRGYLRSPTLTNKEKFYARVKRTHGMKTVNIPQKYFKVGDE